MKKPATPPDIEPIILNMSKAHNIKNLGINDNKNRYLHWDKLRFIKPPEGLTSEEWWATLKLARRKMYKKINVSDAKAKPFVFLYSDEILKSLHWLDQNAFGMIGGKQTVVNSEMNNTYLIRSLIEESITSSQLEGASTTWLVAKEMLRDKRKPTDKNEQMIYNNYLAMQFIKEFKHDELNIKMLLELHKILTQNTMDDEKHAGYLRTNSEIINVVNYKGDILHTPPAAETLPSRIENVLKFANESNSNPFIHPVIKAIILHFLIGYEHPFVDGNGRTARALFYWIMAKQNYCLIEYISISKIIKKAPVKYGKAYLYTETDENDLTYFIEYNLTIIQEAVKEFYDYMDKKINEIKYIESIFSANNTFRSKLNYRQLSLLKHAIKHPNFLYTINGHKNSHGIVYDTARLDLIHLSDKLGLLCKEKRGKEFIFRAPIDLLKKINTSA